MTRRLRALFLKEMRTLFASPIAYIVLTAFVSLSGVYFFQHLISYNQLLFAFQSEGLGTTDFDQGTVPLQINTLNELFLPFAGDLHLFLLAVIPLITMRVFAEERATGTDELLLTTPLRTWEVALAKHATTYLFVMVLLGVSAIYPAVVISKSRLGMAHLAALYSSVCADTRRSITGSGSGWVFERENQLRPEVSETTDPAPHHRGRAAPGPLLQYDPGSGWTGRAKHHRDLRLA